VAVLRQVKTRRKWRILGAHVAVLSVVFNVAACSVFAPLSANQLALEPGSKEERIWSLEASLADALIEVEKIKARADDADTLPAIPPDAETGRCYAKLLEPANYVGRVERRLVKEASELREMIPAKLEWFNERVLVSEAYVRLTVVPETYKWQEEQALVSPPQSKQVLLSPARYETVMIESPEEWAWKPGRGEIEKIDEESGEIVHQQKIPARYRQIKKQVLVEQATYRKVLEPGVYETLRKKVVDVAEYTIEQHFPAKYKTVRAQRVLEPERELSHQIAPVYKDYSYQEKVSDTQLGWRMVPCERDITKALIYSVQDALRKLDYDTGGLDGVLGEYTVVAIHDFQKHQGLATGRLSTETLSALGIAAE
jgi:hypothetical protein